MTVNRKLFHPMIGFSKWVCLRAKGMDYHVKIQYKGARYRMVEIRDVTGIHERSKGKTFPCLHDLYPFRLTDDDLETIEGLLLDKEAEEIEKS